MPTHGEVEIFIAERIERAPIVTEQHTLASVVSPTRTDSDVQREELSQTGVSTRWTVSKTAKQKSFRDRQDTFHAAESTGMFTQEGRGD